MGLFDQTPEAIIINNSGSQAAVVEGQTVVSATQPLFILGGVKPNGSASYFRVSNNGALLLSLSGTNAVTSSGVSTDNAVVRWDGTTGTVVQNSNAILTDSGILQVSGVNVTGSIDVDTNLSVAGILNASVGGDLSGSLPNPNVIGFTSGSTQILYDNIADGNLLIRSGNLIQGIAIDNADSFSGYDSTGGTTVTSTTFVDIPLDGVHKITSAFSHTPGLAEVTINRTGTYVINGYVTIEQIGGNSRSDSDARLMLNTGLGFVEVEGTRITNYSRLITQGTNTASFSVVLDLNAGDKIKLQFNRASGVGTIAAAPNGSGLVVFNIKGPKGEKGDPGTPGAGSNVVVENNDTVVTGAAGVLNFIDPIYATNDGGGQVSIGITGSITDSFSGYDSTGGTTVTSTTFVDIPLDGVHKITSAFSHTPGLAEVTINAAGTYVINGYVTIEQIGGNSRSESDARLMLDDGSGSGFIEVEGTRITNYSRLITQGTNTASFSVVLDLNVGNKLKLQFNRASGVGTIAAAPNGSGLAIYSIMGQKGEKGDPGTPGAGSNVVVELNNTVVTGAASILNFTRPLTVTNDGGGQVSIGIIYGNKALFVQDTTVSTTTSTTFQTKLILGPFLITEGIYRLDVTYGWNYNSTTTDFEARVQEDDGFGGGFVTIGETHQQEPQDSDGSFGSTGTNQKYYTTRFFIRTLVDSVYNWRFQWRTNSSGVSASCWDVAMAIYQIEEI